MLHRKAITFSQIDFDNNKKSALAVLDPFIEAIKFKGRMEKEANKVSLEPIRDRENIIKEVKALPFYLWKDKNGIKVSPWSTKLLDNLKEMYSSINFYLNIKEEPGVWTKFLNYLNSLNGTDKTVYNPEGLSDRDFVPVLNRELADLYKLNSDAEKEILKRINALKTFIKNLDIKETAYFKDEEAESFETFKSLVVKSIMGESGLNVEFISPITKDELSLFQESISKARQYISNSEVSDFKDVLKGTIIVGNKKDLASKGLPLDKKSVAAYFTTKDIIVYAIEYAVEMASKTGFVYVDFIHEFAHKYHNNFIKGGFENPLIKDLFKRAKSVKECSLSVMPKIGDPLSNLREDWFKVKMSSSEYFLTSISDDGIYTYINDSRERVEIQKKNVMKLLKCPSQYGASDEFEFFAEMMTLITLGKVKPSMLPTVEEFKKILKTQLI